MAFYGCIWLTEQTESWPGLTACRVIKVHFCEQCTKTYI